MLKIEVFGVVLVGATIGSYEFFQYGEHGWHFSYDVCEGHYADKFLVVHDRKLFDPFPHHEFGCFFYASRFDDG